ncbi:MAG: endo-1,4-beta-xylanase [Janthinobacterium lividum]
MSDRRRFLRDASLLALATSFHLPGKAQQVAKETLKDGSIGETAVSNGILAGSAVSVRALQSSVAYADLVRSQCRIIVAENEMKFGSLRPGPDTYFFDDADYLFHFAEQNHILVRGHNFMWHRQLSKWFDGYATTANASKILVDHIEHVGGRYAGRVHSWDVANELIHPPDHLAGGMRDAPWFRLLGMDGVDLAYRTARRVDPNAMLCYNDYGIEGEGPDQAAKRAAILDFLRGLQHRKVPIDALGIQGHIAAGPKHSYGQSLTRFMADVQSMGLKLLVTELDVNDRDVEAATVQRDKTVAAVYANFLKTVVSSKDVVAVLTWGLTDKYTWLNGEDSRPDHLPERCLPFDENFHPVDAFAAEIQALREAPSRPLVRARKQT